MGSGFAKGASARGKRIAFGDGKRIIWDQHSEQVFRNNPNIAPPGSEWDRELEWVPFHKGSRLYNTHDATNRRWLWNLSFHAIPGEMFFDRDDLGSAKIAGPGPFVVIEPAVPTWKMGHRNKQWPVGRYNDVAANLTARGFDVVQFVHGTGPRCEAARPVQTKTFRQALAVLANASLYIGPEGGLHHGAAAVGVNAVVLFGGFAAPTVTGYNWHTNLTGSATTPCGSLRDCHHCEEAMWSISVDTVTHAALRYLDPQKLK